MTDHILDDLFHSCAWHAFLEQAAKQHGWPDPEVTRLRAYQLYEEALAVKNATFDIGPQSMIISDEKGSP